MHALKRCLAVAAALFGAGPGWQQHAEALEEEHRAGIELGVLRGAFGREPSPSGADGFELGGGSYGRGGVGGSGVSPEDFIDAAGVGSGEVLGVDLVVANAQ